MADFLLEIGCEEIPARMIDAAAAELARRVGELLSRERLSAQSALTVFSTPRRLAVTASGIAACQADVEELVTGPSVKVAFKDGQPTAAAHAFAKKVNGDIAQLQRVATSKGEYLAAKVINQGRTASAILAQELPKELASIYWPKSMYWRAKNERFVRPVRWLVALLDGEVVPLEFESIRAGRESSGHRTLGGAVKIGSARDYESDLEGVAVVASRAAREQRIRKALDGAARAINGARWREDAALLDTVVNLTECPSVILGSFDLEFLELPEEVLVTVMRDHQKYFALEDAAHKLLPHFLAVLNTDGDPDGVIRHGHERVLRARFNDARFFWQTDQKLSLRDRVPLLKHVTFQKDLGSYYDKTLRVQHLASHISGPLKEAGFEIRPGVVHKAACLSKTDLTTELVKEFTELQGVVGGLYARVQELDRDLAPDAHRLIAQAIYDHYKPESMEDSAPRTIEGAVLSIADKADTIAGMFALGLLPSGSRDPFALRRQANGIVKILGEQELPIPLTELLSQAAAAYLNKQQAGAVHAYLRGKLRPLEPSGFYIDAHLSSEEARDEAADAFAYNLGTFFRERVQFYLHDYKEFRHDVTVAVTTSSCDDVGDAKKRAQAVSEVLSRPEFRVIAIAFKRMKNIMKQAREQGTRSLPSLLRPDLFTDVERQLSMTMQPIGTAFLRAREGKKYVEALSALVALAPCIDSFFENVMVMVDDSDTRGNRLKLLNQIGRSFSGIADFSEIVTESKESKAS